jgi:quercetin dioxygenase-like cupin family protein
MELLRTRTDHSGENISDHIEPPEPQVPIGPPPNPEGLRADLGPVESVFTFAIPAGTWVPAHNAPKLGIAIVLSGESQTEATGGEVRKLGPGDLLKCENPTCEGHETLALADTVIAFVSRPADDSEV